jgi:BirA family biotin operon repressor/biotin-[acetyl-CoA-carboxylase] ligase
VKPREEWHLETRHIGRRVLIYDRLDSTNTLAASLASDRRHEGLVILADEQTAGRGQHGRVWECPAGHGVLVSTLLFPPPALRRPVLLTAWAAVSVCETIRTTTGLQARIKWPNDILIAGRKVCGILIEQGAATVAGIGLNVNQTEAALNERGLTQATSLAAVTAKSWDHRQVARQLIQQLDEEYNRLCQGDLAGLEACWKWRMGLLGKQVMVECLNQTIRGRLIDMTWDALEVDTTERTVIRLKPETVREVLPAQE